MVHWFVPKRANERRFWEIAISKPAKPPDLSTLEKFRCKLNASKMKVYVTVSSIYILSEVLPSLGHNYTANIVLVLGNRQMDSVRDYFAPTLFLYWESESRMPVGLADVYQIFTVGRESHFLPGILCDVCLYRPYPYTSKIKQLK